jgi:hypothetical protein
MLQGMKGRQAAARSGATGGQDAGDVASARDPLDGFCDSADKRGYKFDEDVAETGRQRTRVGNESHGQILDKDQLHDQALRIKLNIVQNRY